MKLFIWHNTKCNQLYSCGDIVAMAPDLAEKALCAVGDGEYAADCRSEIKTALAAVSADLEAAPTVYDWPSAVFFNGGE